LKEICSNEFQLGTEFVQKNFYVVHFGFFVFSSTCFGICTSRNFLFFFFQTEVDGATTDLFWSGNDRQVISNELFFDWSHALQIQIFP
jgi:hypothetical protein